MEVKEKYANLVERQEKIALREGQGLRMLHDDFDPDWKPGDEPHGAMTFTDVMPPTLPAIDWQAEWDYAAYAAPADKIKVLARMMGLKVW